MMVLGWVLGGVSVAIILMLLGAAIAVSLDAEYEDYEDE